MRVLLLLLLLSSVSLAEVVGRNDLVARFRLDVSQGKPYLNVELSNRSARAIPFFFPAGALLHGEREPCLPILIGQDIHLNIPPGGSRAARVEALSLHPFPHTAGTYEFAEPYSDSRSMCRAVQAVWSRHRASRLKGSPMAVSQAAVFLLQGVDQGLLNQHCRRSDLDEAASILKSLGF